MRVYIGSLYCILSMAVREAANHISLYETGVRLASGLYPLYFFVRHNEKGHLCCICLGLAIVDYFRFC